MAVVQKNKQRPLVQQEHLVEEMGPEVADGADGDGDRNDCRGGLPERRSDQGQRDVLPQNCKPCTGRQQNRDQQRAVVSQLLPGGLLILLLVPFHDEGEGCRRHQHRGNGACPLPKTKADAIQPG